jgi:hypothetical protein
MKVRKSPIERLVRTKKMGLFRTRSCDFNVAVMRSPVWTAIILLVGINQGVRLKFE